MKTQSLLLGATLICAATAGACRGQRSEDAPVHLNPNMDNQQYVEAQESSLVFADGRGMRPDVPGTVAVGGALQDDGSRRGGVEGRAVADLPVALNDTLLLRGRERYDIFCAPCHDRAGTGQGIVVERGMVPPPSFHIQRARAMPAGQIYTIVSEGVRNMPAYGAQIPPEDRWAIVAYVRALQLSRIGELSDVPGDVADAKGWSK